MDEALRNGPLTAGQEAAVKLILWEKDRVIGVQGYVGTGKITMLKRARALLEKRGFDIIQRMQTDRGSEFFAYAVQEQLIEYAITFRSIRPGAPQVNGKVERSQKTRSSSTQCRTWTTG
ncbi:AAA family ATPase [Candidatus Rariloculus sp.]|uniref:AAA family ATPase n=1 Tax=Candidatus Rariloculus sp. TaxID=3101265 RepID=UPI003D11D829